MKSTKDKIVSMINKLGSKDVIISEDFITLFKYETVRSILNRLTKDNFLKRLSKGYYCRLTSDFNVDSLLLNNFINAYARKHNVCIAPMNQRALYDLGIVKEEPKSWIFATTGYSNSITVDNVTIKFIHRKIGDLKFMNRTSATIIQAFKYLGENNIRSEHVMFLKEKLTENEKKDLLNNTKATNKSYYSIFKMIAEVSNKKVSDLEN